ncbi:hypothetical protein [Collimonas arenae]|nr:hypothetical protein [Collimonas arenae]
MLETNKRREILAVVGALSDDMALRLVKGCNPLYGDAFSKNQRWDSGYRDGTGDPVPTSNSKPNKEQK